MAQFQRGEEGVMATMLRVHSQDLHEHVASEAGECLDSGLYTDLAIRCIARGLIGLHTCIHNMSTTPLQPSYLNSHHPNAQY